MRSFLGMKEFLISYRTVDEPWALWIARALEEAGYTCILQALDFAPGSNFVLEMDNATKETKRTIAVLSPNFLESAFVRPEWAVAFREDPEGKNRKLVPVMVEKCSPGGLLGSIVHIPLMGLDKDAAKKALLEGLKG